MFSIWLHVGHRDRGAFLRLGGMGGGGGTISDSILGGGHKALFLTNSLEF